MEEIEILELLEDTDPTENTIVPINSSLTRTNLFEIYADKNFSYIAVSKFDLIFVGQAQNYFDVRFINIALS
uniref:Uncharacterized protein n=1 Tax=Romanomermis culicivorax TaxID=13658 RepID=A0A915ICK1_ROMCU